MKWCFPDEDVEHLDCLFDYCAWGCSESNEDLNPRFFPGQGAGIISQRSL